MNQGPLFVTSKAKAVSLLSFEAKCRPTCIITTYCVNDILMWSYVISVICKVNGLKFVIITGLSTSGHLECEQNRVFVHIYHSQLFKWGGLSMVESVVDLSKSDFSMMLGWVDVMTKRRKEKIAPNCMRVMVGKFSRVGVTFELCLLRVLHSNCSHRYFISK